ncbi:GFA family protein [Niveibacterium sp. SC-1]|uniref:GFA family protein n=1 Tax=Niveibacterium sp. SC-1 TaxID=3135646 RepID=UPI00311D4190
MRIHLGSCHCGFVRFEVEVEADIDHVRLCDCSICRRRGALNFRVPADALRLQTPWAALSEYRWGSFTACDYFYARCGVMPFRRPSAPTPEELAQGVVPFTGWAINVCCLEGIDLDALPVLRISGSSLHPATRSG